MRPRERHQTVRIIVSGTTLDVLGAYGVRVLREGQSSNRKQILAAIVGGARRKDLWRVHFLQLAYNLDGYSRREMLFGGCHG